MHRTVKYEGTEEEKKAKAIADLKDWLGKEKFESQTELVKASFPPLDWFQFSLMCDIGGIQGYPVRVWAELCGIKVEDKDEQEA